MEIPKEIKEKYLFRRENEIEGILKSLENEDFSMALKFGHQVKGSADTFNFPQLGIIAKLIEVAAIAEDREVLIRNLNKFQFELYRAKSYLH